MRTAPVGNCARFAAKPLTHGGTPAPLWLAGFERDPLPPLDLSECPRLIVVAPHPDDETLGMGATIARLVASGVGVVVVAVSDGGAAQPGATASDRLRLEATRRHELRRATNILGIPPPISLGLPDGKLTDHEDQLTESLAEILGAGIGPRPWCAATWRGDGHPDHEAVGRAAAAACADTDAALLEYPIWMWHWAHRDDSDVPWDRAYSVPPSARAIDRKRQAARSYRSQFEPSAGKPAILSPFVLERLLAVGEVVFR